MPTATVRILWVLTEFLRLPDRHQRVPLLQEVIIRLFIGEDGLSRTVVDCDDLIEQFNMYVGIRADHMRPGLWTNGP